MYLETGFFPFFLRCSFFLGLNLHVFTSITHWRHSGCASLYFSVGFWLPLLYLTNPAVKPVRQAVWRCEPSRAPAPSAPDDEAWSTGENTACSFFFLLIDNRSWVENGLHTTTRRGKKTTHITGRKGRHEKWSTAALNHTDARWSVHQPFAYGREDDKAYLQAAEERNTHTHTLSHAEKLAKSVPTPSVASHTHTHTHINNKQNSVTRPPQPSIRYRHLQRVDNGWFEYHPTTEKKHRIIVTPSQK